MAPRSRKRLAMASTVAGVAVLAALVAARGPELFAALATCSLAAAAAAAVAHAATLACRCEAWRIAVGAIDDRRLGRHAAHAAGGCGSAAGMVQGAGTAPVRALALRRLVPGQAPPVTQLVVAELPVFLVEAGLIAIVLGLAVVALPFAPVWAGPAALAASVAGLVVLRLVAGRAARRGSGSGLRVLGDRTRRSSMVGLLVAVTALGVLRAWLILVGFGLPHDAEVAGLAFIALGVFGLLPIGPGSTPVAMVAVAGAADPTAAIAAGIAITATSWAGVGLYAAIAGAAWFARRRAGAGRASGDERPNVLELGLEYALPGERAGQL